MAWRRQSGATPLATLPLALPAPAASRLAGASKTITPHSPPIVTPRRSLVASSFTQVRVTSPRSSSSQ